MAKSEQQKAILELGKLLVVELGLKNSVDTLSRWMAHYVSQKIKYAESLSPGVKKDKAEKECFSLILELWNHRWNYKSERRPFRNFDHLFDILENLDPEKETPFFVHFENKQSEEPQDESLNLSDIKNLSPLALQIDKAARIWINYLLHKAATELKNERIEKLVNRAIKLPNSRDAHIIRIVVAGSTEDQDKKPIDKEDLDKKSKIQTLNRRIEELQKFKEINEYLVSQFERELNNLKK